MDRVREALRDLFHGRGSREAAMRAVVEHDGYLVPVVARGEGDVVERRVVIVGQTPRVPPDELWLFSDLETAQRAASHLGACAADVAGVEALGDIREGVRRLVVNPGSPDEETLVLEINERGRGFIGLWVAAVRVERALRQAPPFDEAALRAYGGWSTFTHGDSPSVVTLPGQHGLKNGAVAFTAPDNEKAFLAKLPPAVASGLRRVPGDGATLFKMLASTADLDGAIVNPMGPGAGGVVPIEVAREIGR